MATYHLPPFPPWRDLGFNLTVGRASAAAPPFIEPVIRQRAVEPCTETLAIQQDAQGKFREIIGFCHR
ncbi:MAG: hypothetical protein WCL19_04655 [Verrucomicrobiota bacterium]